MRTVAADQGRDAMPRRGRAVLLLALVATGFAIVAGQALRLAWTEAEFLQDEGDQRHVRTLRMPVARAMVTDRRGEPLAVSTPVESVWIDPTAFDSALAGVGEFEKVLDLPPGRVAALVKDKAGKHFLWLRRHLPPQTAERVRALHLPGVNLQTEYRRYYPDGELFGHLIGFTDIDDRGQEGMELAFDETLTGAEGHQRVLRDRYGAAVEPLEALTLPRPGEPLSLSVDRRLQYLAYRELKAGVAAAQAAAGSAVLLDVTTGEVLAIASQPGFNPNDRSQRSGQGRARNRAIADIYEPGSTIKPFIVAGALEAGTTRIDALLNTAPGFLRVGGHSVKDKHNLGTIDLTTLLARSSNVGASMLALGMPRETLWKQLSAFGFGEAPATRYPGEGAGTLPNFRRWYPIDHATIGFGYMISASTLQLARAYGALADDGRLRPVSLLKLRETPAARQVLRPEYARAVRGMMESVTKPGGTATKARIAGYRVAGKTGTVRKLVDGGYGAHEYMALFAGLAPASQPRLVLVVAIDDPSGGKYYGGEVAAPVFARIMAGALRLLNVAPDDLPDPVTIAARGTP